MPCLSLHEYIFSKTKAEVITPLKQFKTMVELQLGVPVKALQSDWGGKFRPFTKFLTDSGMSIGLFVLTLINKIVLLRGHIDT